MSPGSGGPNNTSLFWKTVCELVPFSVGGLPVIFGSGLRDC